MTIRDDLDPSNAVKCPDVAFEMQSHGMQDGESQVEVKLAFM